MTRVSIDGESACLKIARVSVPDQDVSGLYTGFLKTLCDCEDENRMCRNSSAAQAIGFDADDLIFCTALIDDPFPCICWSRMASVGRDGSIKKRGYARGVEFAIGTVQRGIMRDHDLGFLIFVLLCLR